MCLCTWCCWCVNPAVIRHYYRMRQYHEASGVVLSFLQFLRSEAPGLPADFAADLNAAIKVCC